MTTDWDTILEDLARNIADVLAAVQDDEQSLAALVDAPHAWIPPTVDVMPAHLAPRAQELMNSYDRAQALLHDRLASLQPQRAVARRLDTSVRPSAYIDIRA